MLWFFIRLIQRSDRQELSKKKKENNTRRKKKPQGPEANQTAPARILAPATLLTMAKKKTLYNIAEVRSQKEARAHISEPKKYKVIEINIVDVFKLNQFIIYY